MSALCKVAILAVVPWRCPGRADGGGDMSRPSVLGGLLLFYLWSCIERASSSCFKCQRDHDKASAQANSRLISISILAEGVLRLGRGRGRLVAADGTDTSQVGRGARVKRQSDSEDPENDCWSGLPANEGGIDNFDAIDAARSCAS